MQTWLVTPPTAHLQSLRSRPTDHFARHGFALRNRFGTAPIDNFITEFLPDIARHLHVRIVLVQRIINQVARTEPTASP